MPKQSKPNNRLRKEINFVELFIIGLSGAVATAVFFSQVEMTAFAGPGSLIAWIIGILLYFTIGLTYIELSQTYPEAGGPSRYSIYSHGIVTNLINATSDLIWYLFIPPIEAYATIEGLDFFFPQLLNKEDFPTLLGALVGVIILIAYIPFNYYGIKVFARVTAGFGSIKMIFYALPALALVVLFAKPSNFTAYHGILPFGIAGVFAAMPFAMFAFGGARVVPDFAEETKNKRDIIYALLFTILGQATIYILYNIALLTTINWSAFGIKPGDWSGLSNVVGNPFVILTSSYDLKIFLIIILIGAIAGPFLTGYIYMGSGSRVLLAMGRSKFMSSAMKQLHEKYAIPYWGLIVFAVVGALITFLFAPIPSIYGLISDSVVAGYLGFATNPVALVVLRRQGVTKYKIPFGNVISAIAFIGASLIVFWSGWPSVPYSVVLLAIASAVFAVLGKATADFKESIWYVTYIGFLTLMTYIGSDGALSIIPFLPATIITAVVSLAVFYPAGILSGLRKENYLEHEMEKEEEPRKE
ncbi:APC family permease [Acidianus manzaensis]|uniref:Amino acid transporter n=1 Tax=Acidianus manzaensis TaxID=282676 RepID=A0A1W6JZE5_9CREN|nr:APC family permease [Acidianus manzaensis]ARM75605.1 amino acid transporter [Acidianus manzaensis]